MFPYMTVYVSVQDSEDGKFVNGGVYYAMYVYVWAISLFPTLLSSNMVLPVTSILSSVCSLYIFVTT